VGNPQTHCQTQLDDIAGGRRMKRRGKLSGAVQMFIDMGRLPCTCVWKLATSEGAFDICSNVVVNSDARPMQQCN